ncbi:MAG TPA: hypothetical protein VKT51_05755 [Candidatus Eremiobacteraceae bacterium]|nr:hypothetical protein [Candidatus Eremiobacteraceae bacterium]
MIASPRSGLNMVMIHEKLTVRCAYDRAAKYLVPSLDDLTASIGGAPGVIRLTLPLEEVGLPGGLALSKDVNAHFVPIQGQDEGSKFTAVHLTPVGGGPFPQLLGLLGIERDERPETCTLVLEGSYDPPFGIVGDALDAVAGRKVAKSSARELLKTLARALAARCRQ